MTQDTYYIDSIDFNWAFVVGLDMRGNLELSIENRHHDDTKTKIVLKEPAAVDLKNIGTAFLALAAKI